MTDSEWAQLFLFIFLFIVSIGIIFQGLLIVFRKYKIFDPIIYIRFFILILFHGLERTRIYKKNLEEKTNWNRFGKFRIIYGFLLSVFSLLVVISFLKKIY